MKHIALLTCVCGLMLLGSCKNQSAQNEQPLEVMTFNVRLDAPSDSANNWKYRKDNVCQMITYYQPDLLGMQEVRHNQMEDLKQGLPQYTALGVGRDDGKEAGEYCPIFFNSHRFTLVEYGNFSLSEQPETIGIKAGTPPTTVLLPGPYCKKRVTGRSWYSSTPIWTTTER